MTSVGGVGAQQPRNHLGWTLGRASGSPGMDTSQKDGAALHGSSSCNARCCTLHRPRPDRPHTPGRSSRQDASRSTRPRVHFCNPRCGRLGVHRLDYDDLRRRARPAPEPRHPAARQLAKHDICTNSTSRQKHGGNWQPATAWGLIACSTAPPMLTSSKMLRLMRFHETRNSSDTSTCAFICPQ